ncbi:hypothetical protein CL622_08795 [archaeon]|nr:hypothetical protein [archaeon]
MFQGIDNFMYENRSEVLIGVFLLSIVWLTIMLSINTQFGHFFRAWPGRFFMWLVAAPLVIWGILIFILHQTNPGALVAILVWLVTTCTRQNRIKEVEA